MHPFILYLGLQRSSLYYCIDVGVIDLVTVCLAVFVDDILIVAGNADAKFSFSKKFKSTDIGLVEKFINIQITEGAD